MVQGKWQAIRVLVVDDSALVRQLLKAIVDAQADMTCVGVAKNGEVALKMVSQLRPDVITLDVEMPGMGGLAFLKVLMAGAATPVVMISTQTQAGADTTLQALDAGAVDFVSKPSIGVADGLQRLSHEVVEKIRVAAQANVSAMHQSASTSEKAMVHHALPVVHADAAEPTPESFNSEVLSSLAAVAARRNRALEKRAAAVDLIAIGASTGGTDAIRQVLQRWPATMPPVVVVQHMPAGFTQSFAQRLNALCQLEVKEAEDGERLRQGVAYIAPGGRHLRVQREFGAYRAVIGDDDPVLRHRPSVDALFRSVVQSAGAESVGILLTGMGSDGAAALLEMRRAGAFTVAQDANTSVVYGMPKEAALLGAAQVILPLPSIAAQVLEQLQHRVAVVPD